MNLEYFRLIDRIVSIDLEAHTIAVEARVPNTSTIFEGHFPGRPLMPGVLLIEAMAQASGWLIIGLNKFERMPFLAAVKEAKLRSFVEPGTALLLNATLRHDGSGYAVADAEIRMNGSLTCNAQLTFRLVPIPNEQFRAGLRAVATEIAFPMETAANG